MKVNLFPWRARRVSTYNMFAADPWIGPPLESLSLEERTLRVFDDLWREARFPRPPNERAIDYQLVVQLGEPDCTDGTYTSGSRRSSKLTITLPPDWLATVHEPGFACVEDRLILQAWPIPWGRKAKSESERFGVLLVARGVGNRVRKGKTYLYREPDGQVHLGVLQDC